MSYLVLARKWRPQRFADVVGQGAVVRILQNALRHNRVAHAMIFSGVRGVGKTTLARIMAKALNCRQLTDAEPCNECESCREISGGSAIDLHEIDGASNRGIQEIRELKENIRFFPSKSRYKIIIIDEVHMLTTEAFNALLKTLEEPPAHVYFMFATTELHKVPITILSRCQRYELKRVGLAELVAFFRTIADAEGVAVSDQALGVIAREAEGSVRDGLSLLDQIFSYSGEAIADDDLAQVLGLVDRTTIESLADTLLTGDLVGSLTLLDRSFAAGIDLKRFAADLLGYFRALLIAKVSREPAALLDLPAEEIDRLQERAQQYSSETLYHYFHLLFAGIEEMQHAARPRLALEMAFARAAQAGQVTPVASLLARLDSLLAGGVAPAAAAPAAPAAGREKSAPSSVPLTTAEPPADSGWGGREEARTPGPAQKKTAEKPVEPPPRPAEPAPTAGPTATAEPRELRKHWEAFLDYVKDRKPWMAHALRLCSGSKEEGQDLFLKFDSRSDCSVLQETENLKLLTEFAQDFLQRVVKIHFKVRGASGDGHTEPDQDNPQEERRALANDPLVQMTTEIFGGQVVNIRTGPRSR